MKRLRRIGLGVLVSCSFLLGPTASAVAPDAGAYHGVAHGDAVGPCLGAEGEGFFRLRRTDAGKRIVPPGDFNYTKGPAECHYPGRLERIVAPANHHDPNWCHRYNAVLETDRIPVEGGKFNYRGKANIGPDLKRMNIRFKGHWETTKRLVGKTRIWDANCDRTHAWTMTRL
ncbi:MAG: hypothetical protein M3198_18465 [Actinomycetota bacterium]|nr:hypothetical protein [Actinomycetota bacterium]